MSIEAAIAELERSPAFFSHVARLEQTMENEGRRREAFYRELTPDTKAEFINGRVVVHSPARRRHLRATLFITLLLERHASRQALGEVYVEKCLVRCQRNDYEPDVCFFGAAKCRDFEEDQLIFPPPDLIAEVLSPSTQGNDRTLKLQDYARHGVGEYWIVDADERMVEQYVLPPGAESYALQARLAAGGRLASAVLPGFDVPVAAFFDAQENLRALQASPGPA